MSFWQMLEVKQEAERKARRDAWLDVEPERCELCDEIKRSVLLGTCAACFEAWLATQPTHP